MRVFNRCVIPRQVKMIRLDLRQNSPRRRNVVRHHHKLHVCALPPHELHRVQPVAAPEKKLRIARILAAPDIDDTEVFPRVLHTVIRRFYPQPCLNFFFIAAKIRLVLHISVQKRRLVQCRQPFIRTCDITAVLEIMPGIAKIDSILSLVINILKIVLLQRKTTIQLHK